MCLANYVGVVNEAIPKIKYCFSQNYTYRKEMILTVLVIFQWFNAEMQVINYTCLYITTISVFHIILILQQVRKHVCHL